ncbi:MAG: hypothetical protein COW24_05730 [Candidatus Kerfeldbacteria bacterium CG15_BIG_FIL_POST_REV_8_21_14_020_45_12]|uniref:Solute-binding protein family 5 domain-containing protein n=1 Tax=Candidatus Kerfeldbacteria bacterium CG15_BIG_FIL_POST_REV_8_21_14_020_45_12 TaxID=2014247 RepID=A0A2M7H2B1_9BACT|nr:MAG: hypothetical protein COW24_05730 [Candidatus Kerfeldbacteria bacterium CG15_BIG_FIL_POST_REV_8_21_14_020_45_12]PJA93529.1 MAG: hypothetical protein CO132_02770 [Candidatus Kerfeldbacteria bacterium CG_4_9_14_3_um_filter_45_8]
MENQTDVSPGQSDTSKEVPAESLIYTTKETRRLPSFAQLRYFPFLMNKLERRVFWTALLAFAIGLILLFGRGYFRATEAVPQAGGKYTEGLVGSPQYINPLLSSLTDVDSDLTKVVFSGLFRTTDANELKTDLVTNYVISDDQLTYTFYLKRGVKWHDGEDFTVDDVIFTIAQIQDPLVQSALQSALKGVNTNKIDDFSFSMTLPEPFAPFLSSLTFGILPEHLWFNVPAQNVALTQLNVQPIGTGPYKFSRLVRESSGTITELQLVRNEDYYGTAPFLDELDFRFYPDVFSAVDALKAKKIEGLGFYPADQQADVEKKNNDLEFYSLRIPQYIALFFNQKQSNKVLKDETVRKALAQVVDRERLIDEVLHGQGEPIYSAILPGYVGYNADVEKYEFNRDEAIRLLEEDDWTFPEASEDSDETLEFSPREKDGVRLEFTVSTVDLPQYQQTLAILQESWQDIGVKVNVDSYSAQDIQNSVVKTRDYEALLFGEIVGTDPDPYPFWHSSQQDYPGLALSIFRDSEIDQLLEEARKTTDDEERRVKYLHFQNNIANSVQAIFLFNPHYTYAVHKKVKGVNSDQYITVPADRFAGIGGWYIKTDRQFKSEGFFPTEDGETVETPAATVSETEVGVIDEDVEAVDAPSEEVASDDSSDSNDNNSDAAVTDSTP